ncbi:TrmB family transcriptional regulator [Halalkaliarchaeum desulfuricum]|uniref:TrmB family transcriptional regulator n=1 Tax=Halalkaliarchaeum desulfuricum TaxID=2055893 RepID=A0A343TM88_9EURY|nr:helix-turn-helix domain-containing protein [Halalkaliarchaeum desulfuricum]AUX10210.1 TrmB family transcriptional regulator [Halalkaliarchaeum desulfuricum]
MTPEDAPDDRDNEFEYEEFESEGEEGEFDEEFDDGEKSPSETAKEELKKTRERIEEEADRAVEEFDRGIVDLLSWLLETETKARIYVYLRENPDSTSEEVADGTGLYPSTVREALAELHDDGTVERRKRESAGAGNNPYEYQAIPPSELVHSVVDQVQSELNAVFNLDRRLGEKEGEDSEPVRITVEGDDDNGDEETDGEEAGDETQPEDENGEKPDEE